MFDRSGLGSIPVDLEDPAPLWLTGRTPFLLVRLEELFHRFLGGCRGAWPAGYRFTLRRPLTGNL